MMRQMHTFALNFLVEKGLEPTVDGCFGGPVGSIEICVCHLCEWGMSTISDSAGRACWAQCKMPLVSLLYRPERTYRQSQMLCMQTAHYATPRFMRTIVSVHQEDHNYRYTYYEILLCRTMPYFATLRQGMPQLCQGMPWYALIFCSVGPSHWCNFLTPSAKTSLP